MIIKKITEGYAEQIYDTEKGRFISQRFIADNNCDYEDDKDPSEINRDDTVDYMADKYLPFDMVQPIQNESNYVIVRETYIDCDRCGNANISAIEPLLIVTANQITDIALMHKGAAKIIGCNEDKLFSVGLQRVDYAKICN